MKSYSHILDPQNAFGKETRSKSLDDIVNTFNDKAVAKDKPNSAFDELPKHIDDDSYEMKDFFDIFKTRPNLKYPKVKNPKIDFIGKNGRLQQIFYDFDYQYFNGKFIQRRISLVWSPISKVIRKDGKVVSIRISSQQFKDSFLNDLEDEVLRLMSSAYLDIMSETFSGENKSVNKKLAIDSRGRSKSEIPFGSSQDLFSESPKADLPAMFKDYDWRFFSGVLTYHKVEVFWSDDIMVLPGITYGKNSGHPIEIRLSRKLQKSSRRKLIEALLYQMINAFMMVCRVDSNNKTEFARIANRVREQSKTALTLEPWLVYGAEEFYRIIVKLNNSKRSRINKLTDLRKRNFAK